MAVFADNLQQIWQQPQPKELAMRQIVDAAQAAGYTIADIDSTRPWGGFVRFDYRDGDRFVEDYLQIPPLFHLL